MHIFLQFRIVHSETPPAASTQTSHAWISTVLFSIFANHMRHLLNLSFKTIPISGWSWLFCSKEFNSNQVTLSGVNNRNRDFAHSHSSALTIFVSFSLLETYRKASCCHLIQHNRTPFPVIEFFFNLKLTFSNEK